MHTCTRYHKKYTVTVFCKLEYNYPPPHPLPKKNVGCKNLEKPLLLSSLGTQKHPKMKRKMDTISKSWQCVCIDDISQAINISNNISKISFKKYQN